MSGMIRLLHPDSSKNMEATIYLYTMELHMNIAIIDDNERDRLRLKEYVTEYGENNSFSFSVDLFPSGEVFLKNKFYNTYSIIFVDIYMEGIDGVELAHTVHSVNRESLIIFFTSSQEDMWRAIKTHACFDYLLKNSISAEHISEVLDSALKKLNKYCGTLDFIAGKKDFSLNLSQIQYLYTKDKYTIFVFCDNRHLQCRITFSSIAEQINEKEPFLSCNRGIILNMDYVCQADNEVFVMQDGTHLPLRRKGCNELLKKYQDYQFKKLNEEVT